VFDVFWSPDGRCLGFTTTGDAARMWKVPADGGAPVSICDVKWSRGATWSKDGTIVFAPAPEGPLYRVAASGGDPVAVTALDSSRHETGHRMPWFLPDGQHFLFAALPSGPRGWDIYVGSLRSKKVTRILTASSGVTYAAPGYLLYVRDGKLVAQRFDAGVLKLVGDPVPIGDPPDPGPVDASRIATASDNGRLAMLRNQAPDTRVEWVDHAGAVVGRIPLPPGRYTEISASPDGRSVLASRGVSNVTSDLWLADPARGTTTRLTPAGGNEFGPRWLPDGSGYAFGAAREGGGRIFVARLGDPKPPRPVPTSDAQFQSVTGISPDGRWLVLSIVDPVRQFDVWMLPTDGSAKPTLLVGGSAWEDRGVVSPDGHWLAFNSDETGQAEVYVQPFPGPGPRTRVSFDGGHDPCWARGGKELLYQRDETGGGSVIAVPVTIGERFTPGTPRTLFHRPGLVSFSAAVDGDRILVSANAEGAVPPSLALTLDWPRQLKER
jgi:Tol biopolymer transport system component